MNIRLGYWDKTFAETLQYPVSEAHGLLCPPTRGGKFRDVIAQILLSFEAELAATLWAQTRKAGCKRRHCISTLQRRVRHRYVSRAASLWVPSQLLLLWRWYV